MNWFTKAQTTFHTLNFDDQCDHLKEGDVCLVHTERDSFGPVGTVALCLDCEIARLKEEEEKKVVCFDCKEEVANKDTIRWYWYDYYAPEDQDPLTICKECEIAPKHVQRVARDREMEAMEFGYDD